MEIYTSTADLNSSRGLDHSSVQGRQDGTLRIRRCRFKPHLCHLIPGTLGKSLHYLSFPICENENNGIYPLKSMHENPYVSISMWYWHSSHCHGPIPICQCPFSASLALRQSDKSIHTASCLWVSSQQPLFMPGLAVLAENIWILHHFDCDIQTLEKLAELWTFAPSAQ